VTRTPLRIAAVLVLLAAGVAAALILYRARVDKALSAVGWLGTGGGPAAGHPSCTGVLVAPDLVVTAAHCLLDAGTGAPRDPATLDFLPGLANGRSAHRATGAEILVAPPRALLSGALPYDLGLLRLTEPLRGVRPVRLATGPALAGEILASAGYARSDPSVLALAPDCPVLLVEGPVTGLGCPAVSGYSGGAVLRKVGRHWALVAVMVARGTDGQSGIGTYAVALPDQFRSRIAGAP